MRVLLQFLAVDLFFSFLFSRVDVTYVCTYLAYVGKEGGHTHERVQRQRGRNGRYAVRKRHFFRWVGGMEGLQIIGTLSG